MLLFYKEQQRLQYLLQLIAFFVYLTCDIQILSNSLAFLNVVSHFIDENKALRTLLLALKELQEGHSGENIIVIIINVLSIYVICNRLEYFVIDNATNNNNILETIATNFQKIDNVYYNLIEHCLRYIDYIINLFVQMFLFDKYSNIGDCCKSNSNEDETDNSFNIELQNYRKLGLQDKLHNIVVYIIQSSQRIQKFRQLRKSLISKRDYRVR